jgi:hypothetical protein
MLVTEFPPWQGKCATGTRARCAEEQPFLQTAGAIEENVVKDGILVVETGASSNDRFAAAAYVPGKTELRTQIQVGLAYAATQAGAAKLIENETLASARNQIVEQ